MNSPVPADGYVLENLASMATPRGPAPLTGEALDRVEVTLDPALAIAHGRLQWVGPRAELPTDYRSWPRADGGGGTAVPGLVDPHTHLVFAGHRAEEFDLRARGAAYLEILARGGGILDTVRRVRAASDEELTDAARARLGNLLRHGTTTVEVKSGYGLTTADELRMLRVARGLAEEGPWRLRATFLGAHAVPPEYRERRADYLRLVVDEMLPRVAEEGLASWVDVFCETGVFDLDETREILAAARQLGLGSRIHADEVHDMGGGALAAEMGARSADHLIATSPASIAAMAAAGTACTVLPGTAFCLGKGRYAPARSMVEAGCILALASDLNPGSCHMESLPMAMQIAVVQMGLTPAQCLAAATLNAAWTLEMSEEVGSLEAGKAADVVVLDAPSWLHLVYRMGVNLVRQVRIGGVLVVGEAHP